MSTLRDKYPRARLPHSHFFLTLSRGEKLTTWALRPAMLYTAAIIGPLLGLAGLSGAAYMAMRAPQGDTLASPSAQIALYEGRLKNLSVQLDEAQSRSLMAKAALEGKINDLLSRQAQVEARQSIVATLTDAALPTRESRSIRVLSKPNEANIQATQPSPVTETTKSVSGFAPAPAIMRPMPLVDSDKSAKTEADANRNLGPQGTLEKLESPRIQVAGFGAIGVEASPFKTLESSAAKIELAEHEQITQLEALSSVTDRTIAAQKLALNNAGLSLDRLVAGKMGQGGPFVPVKVNPDGTAFERAVFKAQSLIAEASKLKKIMPYVPLRRPLASGAEITSGFGGRLDPFNGQMAMHTGVDFRLEYGAPVHPTAAGTIISAGSDGGYGNAIDVDHGNGIVTRYGHLSAVLVKEGDVVTPLTTIGRLGSTGRSTGPHLHYEVRVNDEPVNPMRFLKAGEPLFSKG